MGANEEQREEKGEDKRKEMQREMHLLPLTFPSSQEVKSV